MFPFAGKEQTNGNAGGGGSWKTVVLEFVKGGISSLGSTLVVGIR